MASKQQTKSAANDMQSLFDLQGYQDLFKTWAGMTDRVTSVMVEAGTRSTDIGAASTKEALSNLREASQLRDAPADYGKAYSTFVQKQMKLFTRTAQSFAEVTQTAGTQTVELVSNSGQEMANQVAVNAQAATDTASLAAKKAA